MPDPGDRGLCAASGLLSRSAAPPHREEHPMSSLPCRVNDPELWFAELPQDVEAAKALCTGCPLRAECLDGALARSEPWGVWGGELVLAGVVVPRKRPRGRPRKHPLPEPVGAVA
ncbi:WhiB family transcriptional regulator [Quadrisphaera granulorum]